MDGWMDGWTDRWMDGWEGSKAGLRIVTAIKNVILYCLLAYINECFKTITE